MDDDNVDMFSDLDGDTGGDDSGSGTGGDDAGQSAPPKDESKRVNDLMGNWQKEQARANRLERELEKLRGQKPADQRPEGDAPAADADPAREEWISAQREFMRERAATSDKRFEEYGIGVDDITGNTPAEIRASFKKLQALIDAVETKARTRLLQEYGLNPEIAGQAMDPKVDIEGMSTDDFNKLVEKARGWR